MCKISATAKDSGVEGAKSRSSAAREYNISNLTADFEVKGPPLLLLLGTSAQIKLPCWAVKTKLTFRATIWGGYHYLHFTGACPQIYLAMQLWGSAVWWLCSANLSTQCRVWTVGGINGEVAFVLQMIWGTLTQLCFSLHPKQLLLSRVFREGLANASG